MPDQESEYSVDLCVDLDREHPRPGQRHSVCQTDFGYNVIQFGFLHGILERDSHTFVNPGYVRASLRDAVDHEDVKNLVHTLELWFKQNDIVRFINEFRTCVEANPEKVGLVELLRTVREFEASHGLPHPYGLGIVAVYLYSTIAT